MIALDVAVEDELRPGKKAHRHAGLSDRSKATRDGGDKLGRYELVADLLGGSRRVAGCSHTWLIPVEVLGFGGAPKKGTVPPCASTPLIPRHRAAPHRQAATVSVRSFPA